MSLRETMAAASANFPHDMLTDAERILHGNGAPVGEGSGMTRSELMVGASPALSK